MKAKGPLNCKLRGRDLARKSQAAHSSASASNYRMTRGCGKAFVEWLSSVTPAGRPFLFLPAVQLVTGTSYFIDNKCFSTRCHSVQEQSPCEVNFTTSLFCVHIKIKGFCGLVVSKSAA